MRGYQKQALAFKLQSWGAYGNAEDMRTRNTSILILAAASALAQTQETGVPGNLAISLNGVTMEFVPIPAGEFQMGCSPDDAECAIEERPARPVKIVRAFQMGKYEVTQAQWTAVMGENPSRFKGAKRPVEQVSWDAAHQFLKRLNARDARFHYRLPTEAEWEYAARAGSTDKQYGPPDRIAWFASTSGGQTHPAGQKAPNAWGLYDISGNVWEWCQDWFAPYPTSPSAHATGPAEGKFKVLRGASWNDDGWSRRVSHRNRTRPATKHSSIGFRAVREPK